LGVAERTTVVAMRAERAAAVVSGRFDVVFADPPYTQPYPARVFADLRARGAIDEASILVYEHSARVAPPADPAFPVERNAVYGEVALAFLRAEAA
jgi:16S rRNA G966 N2-methylase RsmD